MQSQTGKTKQLSYHRGTSQCTMLVNSCYVSRGMGVGKVSNRQVTFKVIDDGAI